LLAGNDPRNCVGGDNPDKQAPCSSRRQKQAAEFHLVKSEKSMHFLERACRYLANLGFAVLEGEGACFGRLHRLEAPRI
jgi:hypothetical protein